MDNIEAAFKDHQKNVTRLSIWLFAPVQCLIAFCAIYYLSWGVYFVIGAIIVFHTIESSYRHLNVMETNDALRDANIKIRALEDRLDKAGIDE